LPKKLTYLQARLLMLALGVGVSISQSLLAWERGAAPTEVLAPLLYIPVFAGAIFWFVPGGLAAATLSSVVYGTLLAETSKAVGLRLFIGLLLNRITAFVFYAIVIALGTRFVEGRLRKLELYDQIDDVTGLYNSNFLIQDTDLEMSRADRYQSIFSLIEVAIKREAWAGMRRRAIRRSVKDLGDKVHEAIRTMDRAARVETEDRERFFVLLPETSQDGAAILVGRMRIATEELLQRQGCTVAENVSARALTYPEDADQILDVRAEAAFADEARRLLREEPRER